MDVDKICLTCLSSSGPLVSIYDGGAGSCLADMLRDFTKTKPRKQDNLPEKVCLGCLSEINHCYTFKMKCENSSRTLRQLLPNCLPEEPDKSLQSVPVPTAEQAVQTSDWPAACRCTASDLKAAGSSAEAAGSTSLENATISLELAVEEQEDAGLGVQQVGDQEEEEECEVFDYELTEEPEDKTANIILRLQEDLKVDKEVVFTQANVFFEGENDDAELEQQIGECNADMLEKPEQEVLPEAAAAQVTTRKGAAKLLLQQQKPTKEPEEARPPAEEAKQPKRSSRRRRAEKQAEESHSPAREIQPEKQIRLPDNQGTQNDASASTAAASAALAAELKYHCDRCNAGFALEKSLIIHKRQKSCTNRNFKCNECERVFVSPEHLAEHQATHGTHNCPECGLQCESKELLGKHMVQGHKRNLRNQCTVCQKVFTMLSTLRDHMRIHTGEKPFSCNICGKSFTQNANLRQHKLRHSETKSFKCELCTNSFVTKAELASHARTHTGDKPFSCEVCQAKFTTSCSLAKHKRKHTGERPYACDLCPMRFTALNVLKNHRRTHTGERPYVCPFCSKSFTQRGDCQMHQRTHQGDRIYICPVCNLEFKSMPEMRTHLAAHEQDDKRLVHFNMLSNKENGSGSGGGLEDELNEMAESALIL